MTQIFLKLRQTRTPSRTNGEEPQPTAHLPVKRPGHKEEPHGPGGRSLKNTLRSIKPTRLKATMYVLS